MCVYMGMNFPRKGAIPFIGLPKRSIKKFTDHCTRISPTLKGSKVTES